MRSMLSTGEDCRPPFRARVFRRLIRPILRLIFRLSCRVSVEGLENVPPSGSYVVTTNHTAMFDSPFLLSYWPRPLDVAGAAEARGEKGYGFLVRGYGIIPVYRGEADRKLFQRLIACLKAGRPILIAPEGTRSHAAAMQEAKPGAAYIVGKSSVPVVPVGIEGAENVAAAWRQRKRPRLRMVIGKPYILPAVPWRSPERKRVLAENTTSIMVAIARLLPREYSGAYATAVHEADGGEQAAPA